MIFTNTNTAFNGVEYKEIPCITGEGVATTTTEGAVGCLYMNTENGELYKCVSANEGVYTWEKVADAGQIEKALDKIIEIQEGFIDTVLVDGADYTGD